MNKFFCIICILLFISKTENVFSNNLVYDVNNVEVDGKIDSNLDNRKLIESAFRKAFIIFINKTLLKEDAENLYKTKPEIINNLVLTYQITKTEINKNKQYILTTNIKFDKKKINNFLAKKRIPYADISNISLTLFPILVKDKEILLYKENFFYKNWVKSKTSKKKINDSLINYNLALETIEDLEYINKNKENLASLNIKKINSFNGSKNYVLLIIYSTEDKFKTYIKTFIKNKAFDKNIDLKIYLDDENKTYKNAIITLKEEINQIWKEQNLIDINTPTFLDFYLKIKKNNDYLKLKSILDSIDIIENHSVLEMTNKYSKIRVKYKGKLNKIKDKLIEMQISIKIIDNVWKLEII
jgi:hypothetical protein